MSGLLGLNVGNLGYPHNTKCRGAEMKHIFYPQLWKAFPQAGRRVPQITHRVIHSGEAGGRSVRDDLSHEDFDFLCNTSRF